tara:strand:+ start:5260 stop:6123 length:864 start_codon:yes stop_codon:yes gene_type:complete
MRSKLILLGVSSFLSIHLRASCINEVRQALLDKKIGLERFGSSNNINSFIAERLKAYKKRALQEIGYGKLDIELNSSKNSYLSERLVEVLSLKALPKDINILLEYFWGNHNLIAYQQRWLSNLYKEVVFTTYSQSNLKLIDRLETEFKVSEKVLIDVVMNRLKDTGLDVAKPERVWSSLSPSNFGELLLERKIIIDEGFRGKSHGHLIHLLQMDLLRFSAVEIGLPTRVVGDLVEFIGKNERVHVEDFYFEPLEGVWDVLFDSTERDFSTPEVLNIPIEKFFGWRTF